MIGAKIKLDRVQRERADDLLNKWLRTEFDYEIVAFEVICLRDQLRFAHEALRHTVYFLERWQSHDLSLGSISMADCLGQAKAVLNLKTVLEFEEERLDLIP